MTSNGIGTLSYEDITALLNDAVTELNVGELLLSNVMTLYDAMTAIEILEPRMDTGMDIPVDQSKLTIKEIESQRFTASQIVGIADQLLALEMTWISGHMLSQTLFCCIYLHRPEEVQCKLLRWLLDAVLKSASLARGAILKSSIHEEEDFCPDTFDFSLYDDPKVGSILVTSDVVARLEEAETGLVSYMEIVPGRDQLPGEGSVFTDLEDFKTLTEELADALVSRIRFRKDYLSGLQELCKGNPDGARQPLDKALSQLSRIESTNRLAAKVDSSIDLQLNRKLFSQAPPRPITILTISDSLKEIASQINYMKQVCAVSTSMKSPKSVLNFLGHFSGRRPTPNILVQSFLKELVIDKDDEFLGKPEVKSVIIDLVSEFWLPPYFSSKDNEMQKLVTEFCSLGDHPMRLRSGLYTKNRSRMRRRLLKAIDSWENWQKEAERLDELMYTRYTGKSNRKTEEDPYYLSSWVYHEKLEMLSLSFLLGFELQLYNVRELPMVFWYCEYLCDVHIKHLERVATFSEIQGKKRGTEKKAKQPNRAKVQNDWCLLSAKRDLWRGLYFLSLALKFLGCIPTPANKQVYSEASHFLYRFRIFLRLGSPTPADYEQFASSCNVHNIKEEELLQYSYDSFQAAKQRFESIVKSQPGPGGSNEKGSLEDLEEQKSLIKLSLANSVTVRSVSMDLASGALKAALSDKSSRIDVGYDLKYHHMYPSICFAVKSAAK
ncbi:Mak10 subunit, NatC N-terminal acetyltransferase-domain-containing protein [Cladochytrium replicatum]|nr:Mak10 subunit, NatC N-terminal acetyltransferase-domain-containing protein [Cladochytrium replicatum]